MSHLEYSEKSRKGKHLNCEKRLKIDALYKAGLKSEEISSQIS